MSKTLLQKPNIIVKNGEPKAVILDLREYGRLLEIAEAKSDLSELKKIKKSKTLFRPIEEYAGRL
ncbi:hypothetical protein A2924_04060 [Candidatus Giovannonibacteria bacterium RIFCSPLOWO2_01_FULL_44_16]|uniref:Antitoxin n=1 Tax=Candidatus Giovannonibacteria bacterium RIFCSPLOWO2_01_FULL_44_16 TaxID=1798348 RepID=A0A1F5X5G3_9BACT|nr:MAG: hypothetical protein A2924_04060 [Candidatus Giovannonibacteria bacterium RIFCSPLOWO2_01_FULL_44_16]